MLALILKQRGRWPDPAVAHVRSRTAWGVGLKLLLGLDRKKPVAAVNCAKACLNFDRCLMLGAVLSLKFAHKISALLGLVSANKLLKFDNSSLLFWLKLTQVQNLHDQGQWPHV